MDFFHSILICNLPEIYLPDAVRTISEKTAISEKIIFHVGTDRRGAKLILCNEENFRKVISLYHLHVQGKTYTLFPLVTDLVIFGKGTQILACEVELLLIRFAPVLIVFEMKNECGVITFRAALDYPEIPELIQSWTVDKLNISGFELNISPFCFFCKENGHFKIQCLKNHIPAVKGAFERPVLKQNHNNETEKKESKSYCKKQRKILPNLPQSSSASLTTQHQVQPVHPAFGIPSALKKNKSDKNEKKELKPQSHNALINMQNLPHSSSEPICPQHQVQSADPALGIPSALTQKPKVKKQKKESKARSQNKPMNMKSHSYTSHAPLCPKSEVPPALPGLNISSSSIKDDNDKNMKNESMPQFNNQQRKSLSFPDSSTSTQSQAQPAPPLFKTLHALLLTNDDRKMKKESVIQFNDQKRKSLNQPHSSTTQPQVQQTPPPFKTLHALQKNDSYKKIKNEPLLQFNEQQNRNIQILPHSSRTQPEEQLAPPPFERLHSLIKNENGEQEKRELMLQTDDPQHRNIHIIPHSSSTQPEDQPAPPPFKRLRSLIKNDNGDQEKRELMLQSDDPQHRNLQQLSSSTYKPKQPDESLYNSGNFQVPKCLLFQNSSDAQPLLLDTHVASGSPAACNSKTASKPSTTVTSDSSIGLNCIPEDDSDRSTEVKNFANKASEINSEFENFSKGGASQSTRFESFANGSSGTSTESANFDKEIAVCRNGSDLDPKSPSEVSSSNPSSPATNLKHLIPPSLQNDIEHLKQFFSNCKSFKHLYKSGLRYPEGIGALLRQLRKIVKFNKDIKTKSEEEMKFIAWVCLLLSKLQYLHLKKNIQLESFYEPPL